LVNCLEQALMLFRDREEAAGGAMRPPRKFLLLTEAFWPGGLTLVMDASNRVPLKVTANTGKVALRWPKSALVDQLIQEFEGPITGTSANVSGFPSCSGADQVMKQLGSRLPLVLDGGDTGAALPSTIIELHGDDWKVLREGAIPVAEIEKVLQQ
jgi:tRNA threonylcarbamoyl adenosine modification protein (Sua5/YciO/YrdC/YwlC family)